MNNQKRGIIVIVVILLLLLLFLNLRDVGGGGEFVGMGAENNGTEHTLDDEEESDPSEIMAEFLSTNLFTITLSESDTTGGFEGDFDDWLVRAGGNAITKGRFTVWTIPEDPGPSQSYWIIIQVKHENPLIDYTRVDLSGTVVGTDGYLTQIATHNPANLQVTDNIAKLALQIPGGAGLVKDTIEVKSSILEEEQTIVITF